LSFAVATDTLFVRGRADFDYQQLLDRVVKVTSARGAPLETRVDYDRLVIAEPLRKSVRHHLLAAVPSRMDERTRLAWAINTYNFLVMDEVAASAPVEAMHPYLPASARDIKGFFDRPVVEVEGVKYSLDGFERRFVFAEGAGGPGGARMVLDPRAHFALVCAAKGCPPLLPRAYTADSLDLQLDYAVRNALRSPAHLRWNARDGTVEASAIFEWYTRDFGGTRQAFAFLKRYAPERVHRVIEERHVKAISRTIPWDWRLNHSADEEPRHSKAR
jgi:hypothetical protein